MFSFRTKVLYQLWVELKRPLVLNMYDLSRYELRNSREKPDK